ncbi:hypothetical protein MMC34_002985 [Xylographa carneopallida]|nr:hypothetical protein [Xylographa carneopallida]
MSADRLVNQALKRSKVVMLGRIQSVSPEERTTLLRFLLVDVQDLRIRTLMNCEDAVLARFRTSIFAQTPGPEEAARGGSIGNSVLQEAAQIFYSENKFLAEDLEDLAWFENQIEPDCHRHVRTLILSDGAFANFDQGLDRDANFLCDADRRVADTLRNFTGLQRVIFTFTWNAPLVNSHPWAFVLLYFCQPWILPSLENITITREAITPAFVTGAVRIQKSHDDNVLQHYVNDILEARLLARNQPMAM